jgi:hypothetical protein
MHAHNGNKGALDDLAVVSLLVMRTLRADPGPCDTVLRRFFQCELAQQPQSPSTRTCRWADQESRHKERPCTGHVTCCGRKSLILRISERPIHVSRFTHNGNKGALDDLAVVSLLAVRTLRVDQGPCVTVLRRVCQCELSQQPQSPSTRICRWADQESRHKDLALVTLPIVDANP